MSGNHGYFCSKILNAMKSKGEVSASRYVERDISWMYFNQRILLEAAKKECPAVGAVVILGYLFQ